MTEEETYFLEKGFGIESKTIEAKEYSLNSFFEILEIDVKSKTNGIKTVDGALLVPLPDNIPFGTLGTALEKTRRYAGTLKAELGKIYIAFQGELTSIPEIEFRKIRSLTEQKRLETLYDGILDGKYRDFTPIEQCVKNSLSNLRRAISWNNTLSNKERKLIQDYEAWNKDWTWEKFKAFLVFLNIKMTDNTDTYYMFRHLICGAKASGLWENSMRMCYPKNGENGLTWERHDKHWKSFKSLKDKGILVKADKDDKFYGQDDWVLAPFIKNQAKTFKFTPTPKEG